MAQLNVALPRQNRKVIRGMINPLDKATIVSIYPRIVEAMNHTVFPGRWTIPLGTYQNPSVLVIGPSSWFRDIDEESPILEIPHSSIQMADDIVHDYCHSIIEYREDRSPGLFWVPGSVSALDVKIKHKDELEKANINQRNWFSQLSKVADSLWARSNGNPLAISDDMRMAASELGMVDRPWMQHFTNISMIKCFACGNLRNPEYPICPTCKIVDQSHPKAKELKFAI